MRTALAPLRNKNIRFRGEIAAITRRGKGFNENTINDRYIRKTTYTIALVNVEMDQISEPIDHINLKLSVGTTTKEIIIALERILNEKQKQVHHLSGVGTVTKYFRNFYNSIQKTQTQTYDYGIKTIKKLEIQKGE